jgi:hypothetical protein
MKIKLFLGLRIILINFSLNLACAGGKAESRPRPNRAFVNPPLSPQSASSPPVPQNNSPDRSTTESEYCVALILGNSARFMQAAENGTLEDYIINSTEVGVVIEPMTLQEYKIFDYSTEYIWYPDRNYYALETNDLINIYVKYFKIDRKNRGTEHPCGKTAPPAGGKRLYSALH